MARSMSPAQARAKLRQAQSQAKKVVREYNSAARKFNNAVNSYNREARAHNARVRTNQQRLQRELRRLEANSTGQTVHVRYATSVRALTESFSRVDSAVESRTVSDEALRLADLSEGEAANSLSVLNALADTSPDVEDDPSLRAPSLETELGEVSSDLGLRWRGAVFSLDPRNPDAARHFCTSAREILTAMLQSSAPDAEVFAADPDCQVTPNGTPTRRAKVRYLLERKNASEPEVVDFVEADLDNIVELFHTFNDGTHGAAGEFTVRQLVAIRSRVESAIRFLHRLVQ